MKIKQIHFKVGQMIRFQTRVPDGVRGRPLMEMGIISKLHPMSGRQGAVEIRPCDGGCKITRKIQNVFRISEGDPECGR